MDEILLSVIIPTYNRRNQLLECLGELRSQIKPYSDVEIIVADNNSKDGTGEAVRAFIEKDGRNIRYVLEETPGPNSARNAGRSVASGRALALLDDDAVPLPHWVRLTRDYFLNCEGDCFAGRVDLGSRVKVPAWLPPEMYSILGKTYYGTQDGKLKENENPQSTNCAFTAEMFDSVGGFNPKSLIYGDETEFFQRASQKGYKFDYKNDIAVDHCPAIDRLTEEAIYQKGYAWGKGAAVNWLLMYPTFRSRFARVAEYVLRTVYIGIRQYFTPNFGRRYTYQFSKGHLLQLIAGMEDLES